MATKTQSTKLTLAYRGGQIQFGLHKPTGQYRKHYRGKSLYLGSDPDGVLDQWLEKTQQADDDLKNTIDPQDVEEWTVERLCNAVLSCKENDVESGELTRTSFDQYVMYGKWITSFFGRNTLVNDLTPADFVRFKADLAKPKPTKKNGKVVKKATTRKLSLVGLATKMRNVRMFFNFALAEEWIDRLPWGAKTFQMPTKKAIKKAKSKKREKTATRDEILKLWSETLEAIDRIPKHKDGLIFHSKQGSKLIPVGTHNPITKLFADLAESAKVKRENLTFYSLRHTFQTVADENVDLVDTFRLGELLK